MASLKDKTIRDFGDQWSHYADNEGYYASVELLADAFGPLLALDELRGSRVADIGSGTGRIVRMLIEAGAERVVAVEPSSSVGALRENTRDVAERVEIIHGPGEALPPGLDLDFAVSIGAIQFIPDPQPVVRACFDALRPGGRVIVWVYGKEGIASYLLPIRALRSVTTRLPHRALALLSRGLNVLLDAYILACRRLPLPLRDYVLNTLSRLTRSKRRLVIYDQLNPTYVKFYTQQEVRELLEAAGFSDVVLYHRRGYSWTALGVKPA